MHKQFQSPTRRGASLIIAIVLLSCLAVVGGTVLPQILRDRQESRQDLVSIQSRQLHADALRHAEAKREADPEFSGETFTLGPDVQPFSGTFQITTRLDNGTFFAEIEYLRCTRNGSL
jgi:hypothetical protein